MLADVLHLYKSGSPIGGVRLLSSAALQVIQRNDYSARPPQAEISEAQDIYPGDGVAPLGQLICDLRRIGFRGALALELFNRDF